MKYSWLTDVYRFGLVSVTSCLPFEAHLKEVKNCCKSGNNKSVDKTGLRRVARLRALQREVANTQPDAMQRDVPADISQHILGQTENATVKIYEVAFLQLPAGEAHRGDIVYQCGTFIQCESFYIVTSETVKVRSWIKGNKYTRSIELQPSPVTKRRVIMPTGDNLILAVESAVGACMSLIAIPYRSNGFVLPYFIE